MEMHSGMARPSLRFCVIKSGAATALCPRDDAISGAVSPGGLIPRRIDHDPCAHWRMPMDMMRHGWLTRLFQAKQQW
jgi:hypothetical protein